MNNNYSLPIALFAVGMLFLIFQRPDLVGFGFVFMAGALRIAWAIDFPDFGGKEK